MKILNRKHASNIEFGLYVLPAIILISIAIYIPFLMSIFYSLTDWNGIKRSYNFIGLKNFNDIFIGDANFISASLFTAKYCILFIVLVNVIALFLAVILVKKMKFANILRAAFFLPYVFSLIIVGFIWRFIFSQGFESLANITGLGVFKLSWLGTPEMAALSILFVSIWQSVGYYIVLYIAGIQAIPDELLEAAIVDGASPIRRFFSIMLPMLAPSITICVFMALTNSIKIFDIILSLTNGGPGGSTYSVTLDIYRDAFQNSMYGYGSAKALILFIVVLIVTVVQLTFFKSKEIEA